MAASDSHRLDRVEAALEDLHARVARLEAGDGERTRADTPPARALTNDRGPSVHVEPASPWLAWLTPGGGTLALVGRTVMVLGGAFLLRAIAESGSVPPRGGLMLGFGYTALWFGVADRAALRNRSSALFHGLAALIVGLPLLLEASIRFGTLGPSSAAPALGAVAVVALVVAWHRDMPALAAVATVGTLVVALGLGVGTASPLPFASVALLLTLVTTWNRSPADWRWLQWPAATITTGFVAVLVLRALGPSPLASTAGLLLFCAVATFAAWWLGPVRAAAEDRAPSAFDALHALGATVVAGGGALLVAARTAPAVGGAATLVALLLATTSYAGALVLFSDRPARHPAGRLLALQALLLVLMSVPLVMAGSNLAGAFALVAGVFAWVGARRDMPDFLAHGAIFAVAAAIAAGLPRLLLDTWLAPLGVWPAMPAGVWIVMAATAVGMLGPRLPTGFPGNMVTATARVVLGAVLLAIVATWSVLALGPLVVSSLPSPGPVATTRSVLLAAFVVVAAAAGRVHRARALGRLVYPLLAVGAVKFVLDDVWHAGPLLLFVTLATWGVCVMLASRIRRA